MRLDFSTLPAFPWALNATDISSRPMRVPFGNIYCRYCMAFMWACLKVGIPASLAAKLHIFQLNPNRLHTYEIDL